MIFEMGVQKALREARACEQRPKGHERISQWASGGKVVPAAVTAGAKPLRQRLLAHGVLSARCSRTQYGSPYSPPGSPPLQQ